MLEGEKDYGGMGLERMEWDKKDLESGEFCQCTETT